MNSLKTFSLLAVLCFAFCFAGSASGASLFAGSDRIDKFNGTWTTLNFPGVIFNFVQMSFDGTGRLFVSAVTAPSASDRPYSGISWFNPATPETVGKSLYVGRFAFDASNNFYAIARYSPVGTCFSPIYKLPPSIDETAAVTLGAARGVNDVIFIGGNIVIAGSFDRIYSGDLTSFVPAGHVASWSGTAWSAIGSGVPGVVNRIVADSDSNLVALVGGNTLWRWDGTVWTRYSLTLTAASGTPTIVDLDFGTSTLFVTGNFNSVNGVAAVNVTALSWTGTALEVAAVADSLPLMDPRTILAFNDTLVWVGGAQGGEKAVSVWRGGAAWVSLGVGFTPSTRSSSEVDALAFGP